jgi:hypothetical protein
LESCAALGPDAQDRKRYSFDASNAILGVFGSDQHAVPHDCTLEAMRTQGFLGRLPPLRRLRFRPYFNRINGKENS